MRSSPSGQLRVHDRAPADRENTGHLGGERTSWTCSSVSDPGSKHLPAKPSPTSGRFQVLQRRSGGGVQVLRGSPAWRCQDQDSPCHPATTLLSSYWNLERLENVLEEGERREARPESSLSKEDHK